MLIRLVVVVVIVVVVTDLALCVVCLVPEKAGAGQLCFNGGGDMTVIGLPNYSARVAESNANAGNDFFVGGKQVDRHVFGGGGY